MEPRWWHLRTHPFWVALWPNLLSTVLGIVLGLPAAFWLNDKVEQIGEKAKQAEEHQRLLDGLSVIQAAIEFDTAKLLNFGTDLKTGQLVTVDLALDTSAWDATKDQIVPLIENLGLKRRIAYYFGELSAISHVNDLYIEQYMGASAALNSAAQTRQNLRGFLLRRTQELIEEGAGLTADLAARTGDT